jgi:flagellar hook-associated protein 1 FlgK
MLSAAARALETQRFGMDVVGQNIANVNTIGYSKRTAIITAVPPADRWSAGLGAEVEGVRAARDRLIDRRFFEERPWEQRDAAIAEQLGIVEVALGAPGASIDRALADFFDAFASLNEAPTSVTARQEVVLQGQALTATFRDMADRFDKALRSADAEVRATVERVNELSQQIASLNNALSGTSSTSVEGLQLRDKVNVYVKELSGLIDIEAVEREGGGFDVTFGAGRPLVIGESAFDIGVANRAVTGVADLTSDGAIVTGEVLGGRLGGMIRARDVNIPDYQARLDELAYAVVEQVNALHVTGFDLNGNAGVDFFSPLPAVAEAASSMQLNAALSAVGGASLVAVSSDPAANGNNDVGRQLAALRDARIMAGGTTSFVDHWAQMVYRVGRDVQAARDEVLSRGEIVRQIENLQDSVSGVSLDEEAADMLRFQRAYEANARFFTTIDETLETLIQMVGV